MNSIEEDIKIIENLKEAINSGLCYFGSVTMYDCGYQEALEHILSDYKRVLKENEELKRLHIQDNKHLDFIMEHSISIQKVKDKIEELKQKAISYGLFIGKDESFNIESKISILQELLEGRK